MAEIDEVRERIGWLKVLFGLTAAILASLLSWLLTDLVEKYPDILKKLMYLDVLNWWYVVAFVVIAATPLTIFHLVRLQSLSRRVLFVGLVAVVAVGLAVCLVADVQERFSDFPRFSELNSWHAGAAFVVSALAFMLLVSMWEISSLIRRLRGLE